MASYEFKRVYYPRLGRYVYEHKGSGLIVDNIFKPLKSLASSAFKKVAKPFAKKSLESGVAHAGDRLGKKAAEKSGDLIMKQLHGMQNFTPKKETKKETKKEPKKEPEDYNLILNRLISGSGSRQ